MKSEKYYRFFNNLANPLRIKIIEALFEGEKTVGELVLRLGVEQSKLSHALANLKCCHIVESSKKGKNRIYSLNKKTIVPILRILDKHALKFCCKEGCNCK